MPREHTKTGGKNRSIAASRRGFLAAAGVASAAGFAGCLADDDPGDDDDGDADDAGEWEPTESIRNIIPYDEGGGTDVYARGIVGSLTDAMGVDIQIDNVSGGGGLNGFGEAIRSEPDGHTIVQSATPLEVTPQLLDDPGFDQRDLEGIANIGRSTWCLIVNEEYEGEVETFDDVKEKHNSGEWDTIGVQEPGSPQDIMTTIMRDVDEFADEYDWNWTEQVQYTGTGPIAEAVTSGEVPCGIGTDAGTEPDVAGGGVYPVVTFWSEGTEVYEDIPSITDEGYPDVDFISGVTRGVYAPPETPDEIIQGLTERFEEAVNDERYEEWNEETGNPIFYEGPEEANAAIDDAFEALEEIDVISLIED